jgi:adenylate cyclase
MINSAEKDQPPRGDEASLGEPFPLKDRFRRRFVPALLGFVGLSLAIIGFTAKAAVETIYLELAQRRAQTIERSVSAVSPAAWAALMEGRSVADLADPRLGAALIEAFAAEVRHQNLPELKVYDLSRRVLYATHADEIGTVENGAALRDVIAEADSGIVAKTLADGTEQYELYVPVFDGDGAVRAVFELYEPVGYLNAILIKSAVPIVALPGLFFLLLGVTLDRLVGAAQGDIDRRTQTIDSLRRRLESFVSATAVEAARGVDGDIASKRVTTTLFFSDIRDFTGFSERHTPEQVVGFLNTVMGLQVGILERHGGDIDKMIGDAVLARFDGDDGAAQAVAAARAIQAAVAQADLPRALGIGIYKGDVISGTIGPENRRDFTVIGDAVNVAARLCSAAGAGEIVAEAGLADAAFQPPETVSVKGRETPVPIRRWSADAA